MSTKKTTVPPAAGPTPPRPPGPMVCEQCGEAHGRCKAHNRAGGPCGRHPMQGQAVCPMHGGKTPGARENAANRQADAKAERELQQLWKGLGEVESVTDPYQAMSELAGSLRALVDEAGLRVDSMKHLAGGEHLTQLRAEVVLFEKVLARYQATLDALGRLELSGRHLVMQEKNAKVNRDWADLVMSAQHHAWSQLARAVPSLLPEHRALYLTAFTQSLGAPAPEVPELPAGSSTEEDA